MNARGRRRPLPKMIRFLAGHCALGVAFGAIAASLMLLFDIGSIGRLVAADAGGRVVPLALLYFGFAVTFGSLAMGSAVFLLPRHEEDETGTSAPDLDFDHPLLRRSAARTRSRWKV